MDDERIPASAELMTAAQALAARKVEEGWPTPDRITQAPDGSTVVLEWQRDGEYVEAEIVSPAWAEWMRHRDDRFEHWCEVLP